MYIIKKSRATISKELDRQTSKKKISEKSIWHYYGALPDTYGDALTYQKKLRDGWE